MELKATRNVRGADTLEPAWGVNDPRWEGHMVGERPYLWDTWQGNSMRHHPLLITVLYGRQMCLPMYERVLPESLTWEGHLVPPATTTEAGGWAMGCVVEATDLASLGRFPNAERGLEREWEVCVRRHLGL